ncbi:hypothetical protein OF829_03735 [Sphingomonas sp. LB-2]|uniref:hypothetical protein n=1 Tax=Sphingomonas caeni TaxID=2984949 RepID=UPI00222EA50E|nr:hypothetical protein [Sphingomonas caeni]MCW3846338.1 hypothetical protein [Sphingomonas caeni]
MIGEEDAASALDAVDRTRSRAVEFRAYAHAGDIVIGWGLVWLIANLASYASPGGTLAWPVGILLATLWSIWRGRRHGKGDWRGAATGVTIVALVVLVLQIAGVDGAARSNALISIFVAAMYVFQGIWWGRRFAWIGLVIAACVIGGWFFDRAHLELWLGVGGGGALIVSGLWLKRA